MTGRSVVAAVVTFAILSVSCRDDKAVRVLHARSDARVTVEQWGAPWTPRIVVVIERNGRIVVEQSKSVAGSAVTRHVLPLSRQAEAQLVDDVGDLLTARTSDQTKRTDPSRMRVRVAAGSETWERSFVAPYGDDAVAAIRKINRHLPSGATLSVD